MDDRNRRQARGSRPGFPARLAALALSAWVGAWAIQPAVQPACAQEALPQPQPADTLAVIEFRDLSLQNAMHLFSLQTGLNVVPSQQAADARVSLFLRNISPRAG